MWKTETLTKIMIWWKWPLGGACFLPVISWSSQRLWKPFPCQNGSHCYERCCIQSGANQWSLLYSVPGISNRRKILWLILTPLKGTGRVLLPPSDDTRHVRPWMTSSKAMDDHQLGHRWPVLQMTVPVAETSTLAPWNKYNKLSKLYQQSGFRCWLLFAVFCWDFQLICVFAWFFVT